MSYSPSKVANNILNRAFAEKIYINPMKLQRILYFVASEYQKATKRTLLEEPFAPWEYGPVSYSVYDKFRAYGKNDIKRYARDLQGNALMIDETQDIELGIALTRIWDKAKNKSAVELSEITHTVGSAWDRAYQKGYPVLNPTDIEQDTTYREALEL